MSGRVSPHNEDEDCIESTATFRENRAPVVHVGGGGMKGGDDGGNLNIVATATASQEEETTVISSKAAVPSVQEYIKVPASAAAAAFKNKFLVPGNREFRRIATSAGKTFVRNLHTLLTTTPNEYSSIISWNEEGTSVIVHDVDAFISTVMPVHYKDSKFESWSRRMRRWGFAGGTTKKIITLPPPSAAETDASNDGDGKQPVPLTKEITIMEFTNELFTRDRPELVALMMDERKAKKQAVLQGLYNSKVGVDEINSVAIGGRVMKRQISSVVEQSNKEVNAAKKQRVTEIEEATLKSGVCVHKPTLSSLGGVLSSEEASSFGRESAAESAARVAGFNEMTATMMNMKKNLSPVDGERAAEAVSLSAARAAGFNEMTATMMNMKKNLSPVDGERAAEAVSLSAARAAGFSDCLKTLMNMKKNSGAVGYYNSLQPPYYHHHRSGEEYSLLPPPPPKLQSYGMMMNMPPPPPPSASFHRYPPPHYPPPPHRYDGYGVPPRPPRYGDSPPPPQHYSAPPPPPQPPMFFDPPPPYGPPSHLNYHQIIDQSHRQYQRQSQHPVAAAPAMKQPTNPVGFDVVFNRKSHE